MTLRLLRIVVPVILLLDFINLAWAAPTSKTNDAQDAVEADESLWFNCYLPTAIMLCAVAGTLALMSLSLALLALCMKLARYIQATPSHLRKSMTTPEKWNTIQGSGIDRCDSSSEDSESIEMDERLGYLPSWAID